MRSMAMVSPSPAVTTLTPPSSSHGDRSSWDLAVPLDNENPLYDKTYMSHDASARLAGKRQLVSNQPNGYPRYTQLRRNEPVEPYHSNPMPNRVEALGKNPAPNGTGSESDSLLELYDGEQRTRTKGSDAALDPVEQDQSHWIHRDKLAEIERTELEAAGFIPPQSKTTSRSSSRSRPPRRKKEPSPYDDGMVAERSPISPPPGRSEFQENPTSDRSSPVDCADRDNGSRIPRPTTSKIPIPRYTPATSPSGTESRSRSGSANLLSGPPAEALAVRKTRKRGGSVGSQVLLDDVSDPGKTTGSDEEKKKKSKNSPTKAKTPRNKTPTSTKRANSKPRTASNQKPRANSGSRPRTASRPTTARPEGDAPWIATMYKPDPRLPQDQQMLPTHAKRMAQEQWEKDGKVANMYDKEFRPLNDFDYGQRPPQSPSSPTSMPQEEEAIEQVQPQEEYRMETPKSEKRQGEINWPLSPEPIEKPERSPRPSPNSEHGGFKLTPSVSPPPPQNESPVAANGPRPASPIRVPEPPAEKAGKKSKKSLCCCTIM